MHPGQDEAPQGLTDNDNHEADRVACKPFENVKTKE